MQLIVKAEDDYHNTFPKEEEFVDIGFVKVEFKADDFTDDHFNFNDAISEAESVLDISEVFLTRTRSKHIEVSKPKGKQSKIF